MSTPTDFKSLVVFVIDIINPLLYIIAGLALLAFFWGLVKFISRAGDEKSHAEGKSLMVWGLIALFVMVSVYGILRFFYSDLFPGSLVLPVLPE
jgi:hypothetical protein